VLFLLPRIESRLWLLNVACVMVFVGIWIEKGMGLIVPGFIPSTLHELVEYQPSLVEWKVTAGVWALGLMIYTVALKIALPVFTGRFRPALVLEHAAAEPRSGH
jgi:molybdopterin-containing oxidoreductase family membrane subunit